MISLFRIDCVAFSVEDGWSDRSFEKDPCCCQHGTRSNPQHFYAPTMPSRAASFSNLSLSQENRSSRTSSFRRSRQASLSSLARKPSVVFHPSTSSLGGERSLTELTDRLKRKTSHQLRIKPEEPPVQEVQQPRRRQKNLILALGVPMKGRRPRPGKTPKAPELSATLSNVVAKFEQTTIDSAETVVSSKPETGVAPKAKQIQARTKQFEASKQFAEARGQADRKADQ